MPSFTPFPYYHILSDTWKYHHIPSYTRIYLYIPSYTFIYLHIPSSYTFIYHHIPPNTIIYLNIFHIAPYTSTYAMLGTWGPTWDPKNGHISSFRAFPKVRIWHYASWYVSKGLIHPNGAQIYLSYGFKGTRGIVFRGWYIHIYIYMHPY